MLAKSISLAQKYPLRFVGLASALILASAFGFQFAGYFPCEMCWWQRYPYMAIIAVALVAEVAPTLPKKLLLALTTLLFAIDAALAGFHVGVEQGWWEGITTCATTAATSGDLQAALNAIMNAPVVRCDEIAWSLFGISMAGYNFLLAAGLTAFSLVSLRRMPEES